MDRAFGADRLIPSVMVKASGDFQSLSKPTGFSGSGSALWHRTRHFFISRK
jgi:hypothetical protein